jgi:WD40 repeat protein
MPSPEIRLKVCARDVVFSGDGRYLGFICRDSSVRVWDLRLKRETFAFENPEFDVCGISLNRDGSAILIGGDKPGQGHGRGAVFSYDLSTEGGTNRLLLTDLAVSPYPHWHPGGLDFAVCGQDRVIKVWNGAAKKWGATLKGHAPYHDGGLAINYAAAGKRLCSVGGDSIRLWDMEKGMEVALEKNTIWTTGGGVFSPDGQLLCAVTSEATRKPADPKVLVPGEQGFIDYLAIWTSNGRLLHRHRLSRLTWPRAFVDRRHLIGGQASRDIDDREDTVVILDVEDGSCCFRKQFVPAPAAFSFCPETQQLATSYEDGTVRLWDLCSRLPRAVTR